MSKPLEILSGLMSLAPAIMQLITSFERPGNGTAKAQLVGQTVAAAINALPDDAKATIHADVIGAFTAQATTDIVGFLNTIGEFQKSSTPAPLPTPAPAAAIESPEQIRAHISHMEDRLVVLKAGNAPDKDAHITALEANIADEKAKLPVVK